MILIMIIIQLIKLSVHKYDKNNEPERKEHLLSLVVVKELKS